MTNPLNFKIEHIRGHFEVTINGKFFCSADTFNEAIEEVKKVYG